MLGPYIKSRGTRGTKMSANADLITVETYVQQGETIWKPFFHLWAKNVLSPISMYMWNKEAIWHFKFKPKIWKKQNFFSYLGGPGGLTSNPGERKFQGSKTS